ncbi:cupin domain-containing protein [Candidatus Woesearchaeota archaeon]|nr:cupin domain-containing protein [Candidatus Woesearchaeota archaeon]
MSEKKFKEEHVKFLAGFKGERHDHLWGYELWIENNEKYCNKLLILHEGFESSWHYHERKDETFVVIEGKVSLTYASGLDAPASTIVLEKGDKFRLEPRVIHTFKSLVPKSTVLEISTTDNDDNVKLRPARRLNEEIFK